MQFRPTPPAIPAELLDRFGEPEHVFAPNIKFRAVTGVCGVVLLVVGVTVLLLDKAGVALADVVSGMLAVPMVALGAGVLVWGRRVPLHWVFVCPRGLLRRRGEIWDRVDWAEVERFEETTLTQKRVTFHQCRIVTTGGNEWGFMADQTAEYERLAGLLKRKVEE